MYALVLTLALVTPTLLSAQSPEQARHLIEQGRIAEAYGQLQAWVERVPDDPVALVLLASVEFDGVRSQEYYRRAQQADPEGQTAPTALLGIAQCYYARGFYSTAHRLAQQVLEMFPASNEVPWATLLIGRSLLATEQPAEAAEQVKRLLVSNRPDVRVAATAIWAQAMLADRKPREVVEVLSAPGWSSFPYELSLLAEAYQASGQATRARDVRRQAELARRSWMADSLRYRALAPPTGRVPEPPPAPAERQVEPTQAGAPSPQPVHKLERARSEPAESERASTETSVASDYLFRGGPKGYSLQVGAFGNPDNARSLQRKLRDAGYEVVVHRTGSLHRVWVGNYSSVEAARAAMPEVARASAVKPAIVRNR